MNPKQIKRQYKQLLAYYKKEQADFKPVTNLYICGACGHVVKTVEMDAGVTPFVIPCPVCGGAAFSQMYQNADAVDIPITMQWVRPTLEEVLKFTDPWDLNHVLQGGLLPIKITPKEGE